jgi:hypothetical protein
VDVKKLLSTAPVKGEFAPTLPQLLAPRIDSLPRIVLRITTVVALLVAVAVILVAVRLRDPVFSYPGHPWPVTFSTTYSRSMVKEPTPSGALLLLEQHSSIGLEASFEVSPLTLPPYSGQISGELPIIASNMIAQMQRSDPTFVPYSRGRTRINFVPGYTFTYQRTIDGRHYWGRYVLITPNISGDRRGLLISMLTDPTPLLPIATKPVTPDSIGSVGVLFEPLERLHIGS